MLVLDWGFPSHNNVTTPKRKSTAIECGFQIITLYFVVKPHVGVRSYFAHRYSGRRSVIRSELFL